MADRDYSRPTRIRLRPGLYDPRFEHDSCGVGFVVDMKGRKSNAILDQALTAVCCLNHRGAAGAEADTGDGAGITIQMPDAFYRAVVAFELPPAGAYATGIAFLPDRPTSTARRDAVEQGARRRGLRGARLARRCRSTATCPASRPARSCPRSAGVRREGDRAARGDELERHVYLARKRIEHGSDRRRRVLPVVERAGRRLQGHAHARPARARSTPTSRDERVETALALVHSRFSHQHVPELAARAPVPHARAQRRDQHRAGQRELDARPRGRDGSRAACRATSSARSRSARRARPTRRASTRRSSCSTSRAGRCITRS